jgi:flagellar hook-length control protein FliK
MDNIGSMNSLRDDTTTSARIGKNANARRANDPESSGAFGDLLASVIAPPVAVVQPVIPQETAQVSNPTSEAATKPAGNAAATAPAAEASATSSTDQNAPTNMGDTPITTAQENIALGPQASQADGESLLAQLSGLGVDEAVATPAAATQASAVSPSVITNAATLSASRSNVGVAAAAQSAAPAEAPTDATPSTATTPAPSAPVVSNDNAALLTANKSKPAESDTAAKTPGHPLEPVSTTLDGAGSTTVVGGHEVAAPANDQANRAPQLTPQTIPMLAATMMRRLESGSRQFTMRLDPPELGQVEVKLTVAADKKVRAVVSADRPEALADLVRSARELVRALAEAGLDLEDNGLTFQMNDPSAGGQQRDSHDQQASRTSQGSHDLSSANTADIELPSKATDSPNDPFQRWHRARIVLTA